MHSASPHISIIMSVYNDERFLPQALDSILAQSEPDFELLVIDDASTDQTPAILKSYAEQDHRIRRDRNNNQQGLAASLNRAARSAQGELLARMDSDDISLPTRLAEQKKYLLHHPEVGVLGTCFEKMDEQSKILGAQTTLPTRNEEIRRFLLTGNPLCHGSVMIRKAAFEAVGGYRPAFSASQDYDLWLRIPDHIHFSNLPAVLYQHRRHGGSVSSQRRLLQRQLRNFALALYAQRQKNADGHDELSAAQSLEAQVQCFKRFSLHDLKNNKKAYAQLFLETGKRALKHNNDQDACHHFLKSLQLQPLQIKAYRYWLETLLGIK